MSCKQDKVCKYFVLTSFTHCLREDICKFYEEVVTDGPAKQKRKYKKRAGKSDEDIDSIPESNGVTEKQFKKARKKIANAQQNHKLSENQELALKGLKGLRYKTMTEAQREQVVNIAQEL